MISLLTQQDMHTIYWSLPIDACACAEYSLWRLVLPCTSAFIRLHRGWSKCSGVQKATTFMDFISTYTPYTHKKKSKTPVSGCVTTAATDNKLHQHRFPCKFAFVACFFPRPREFNSIYKFYAFITINIRRTTITATFGYSVSRCSIDYMPHLIRFACWLNLLHFHSITSTSARVGSALLFPFVKMCFALSGTFFNRIKHDKTV